MKLLPLTSLLTFITASVAQFPPQPVDVHTLESKLAKGASISYKETHICETTPGVKSYSGYVNLPAEVLRLDYNVSTFFWYFEARKSPSNRPLLIYLAGGPGESSLFGAIAQGGPCYLNSDSNSTTLNPWSWNNDVNILYIDQPAQTGFSYDVLVNGTLDQLTGTYTPTDFSSGIPSTNATFLVGTFPSQSPSQTANNSVQAAHALYHFSEIWMNEFPGHKSRNRKISLWANSWGGFYGPATMAFFERQNELILAKSPILNSKYTVLELDSLGILNGCLDPLIEAPHYAEYAYNNTYGLQAFTQDIYEELEANFTMSGGCRDAINGCRTLAAEKDPDYVGANEDVNELCAGAFQICIGYAEGWPIFAAEGISAFDISHNVSDLYPYNTGISTYFNRAWVQEALGVPLNFTAVANAPFEAFVDSFGDATRNNKTNLEYLLSRGKKVVMIYGDRDWRCNWLGAENVSLSLDFPGADVFASSGYEKIITNDTYTGGIVRQAKNLSFNRVFEAGHYAHGQQPETVYQILHRVLNDMDIATGEVYTGRNDESYQTTGPLSSFDIKNELPPPPPIECSVWQVGVTCTQDQYEALADGSAMVVNDVVISPAA